MSLIDDMIAAGININNFQDVFNFLISHNGIGRDEFENKIADLVTKNLLSLSLATKVDQNLFDEALSLKLDASAYAQLSNAIDQKLDATDYVQHFRGLFSSYANLTAALPMAVDGDYAHIDSGSGFDRMSAIWDTSDKKWVVNAVNVGMNTDEVPEGQVNQYFTTSRVRNTTLTGLDISGNSAVGKVSAADSHLSAFAKLQRQFDDLKPATMEWVNVTTIGELNAKFITSNLPQYTKIEVSRWGGLLWIRGFFRTSTSITSSDVLFSITNNNYKLISPAGANTALAPVNAWINASTSAQFAAISQVVVTTPAEAVNAIQNVFARSGMTAGQFFYIQPACLGMLVNP
ncbi:TPA: hypothetical protein LUJ82_003221 [Acinetobacter baumannii]|jgi:hypothetical protein|uniref:hypothetical protein n=1 Tax=Acinetobacter TaxID=469 RepID=UPI0002D07B21|nr:hypothetical protein [Acinetobacter baumannii]EKT7934292.1 hypothetical protein [Acinetobacter baumannii]EKT8682794.1 hypothetical protein [Acinetobacter baumannii]EKT9124193.1 hypothetical protein [Acinetobacter baumannii]EKT9294223.1 hypothetical protein [Acinetobacter baumannii]EKU3010410.1 hypothetical protein [Acinetobacter baumannii]